MDRYPGKGEEKFSFSHTDLDVDRMIVSEDFFPVSPIYGCILNDFLAAVKNALGAGDISKAHSVSSLKFSVFYAL